MSEANTTTTPAAVPTKTVVCWCGCGGLTKSKFVQGHDSRFHSRAKQVLRGQLVLDEQLALLPHQPARDEFLAYMESQKPSEAARKATADAKAAEKLRKKAEAAAAKLTPPVDDADKSEPSEAEGEGEESGVVGEPAITA